ncbi:MAG TPA: hypothetical protein VED40_19220 [Azospirillaceae bacterium]|nr:hypothetical protein [Azospirillaceae bacterium]
MRGKLPLVGLLSAVCAVAIVIAFDADARRIIRPRPTYESPPPPPPPRPSQDALAKTFPFLGVGALGATLATPSAGDFAARHNEAAKVIIDKKASPGPKPSQIDRWKAIGGALLASEFVKGKLSEIERPVYSGYLQRYGLSSLSVPVIARSVAVISALPDNDAEFKSIFGSEPTYADLDALERVSRKLGDTIRPETSSSVERALSDTESTIVVLIGHNDHGNFVLRSGERSPLKDVASACVRNEKICIFVACKSKEYVGKRALSLKEDIGISDAADLVNALREIMNVERGRVSSSGKILVENPDRILYRMERVISSREQGFAFKAILKGFEVVVLFGLYGDDNDEDLR